MKKLILALISIWFCGFAAEPPKSADNEKIQGVWIAQSGTVNSHAMEEVPGGRYTFSGDQLAIKDSTGKEMKFSFKLDPSSTPKRLVLQPEQQLTNATLCAAAYELNGDTLKVVTACPGSRPTEISDKNNQMLITLTRQTSEKSK